jgi:hypothetical protein
MTRRQGTVIESLAGRLRMRDIALAEEYVSMIVVGVYNTGLLCKGIQELDVAVTGGKA